MKSHHRLVLKKPRSLPPGLYGFLFSSGARHWNETIQNENFEKYIYYLKKYLIHDDEISLELKPFIENNLSDLYINFNDKQKKEKREIKVNLEEKIQEYKTYRINECRLHNGYNPEIMNSQIN